MLLPAAVALHAVPQQRAGLAGGRCLDDHCSARVAKQYACPCAARSARNVTQPLNG